MLLQEPQRIAREYERRLTQAPDDHELHSLQALVQKVKQGISRLIDLYQEGVLDRTQFEPRLRRAQERLQTLTDQVAAIATEQSRRQDLQLVIGQVETFAQKVADRLEEADRATQRQILTTLIKEIQIGESAVKIVYKIDSPPFVQAPEGGVLLHCWWRVGDATQNRSLGFFRTPATPQLNDSQ